MINPYINLAKSAITTYIKTGKIISPPNNLPSKMLNQKTGVFVSIHGKEGSLRGCIGTFFSTKKSIAQEIIANAIAAATQDPRFPPVKLEELPNLEISVDILSKPKLVPNTQYLNPKRYGLIVSTKDGHRGLLLPDIPGVETPEEQIAICRRKAGIGPTEPIKIEIFTVERHSES